MPSLAANAGGRRARSYSPPRVRKFRKGTYCTSMSTAAAALDELWQMGGRGHPIGVIAGTLWLHFARRASQVQEKAKVNPKEHLAERDEYVDVADKGRTA